MTFPPEIPAHLAAEQERLHAQMHARHAMQHAVHRTLEYARQHADHRAELYTPDPNLPYDLAEFLLRTQRWSQADAEANLVPRRVLHIPRANEGVHVIIVIPDWVNTARGNGNPELHEPNWVRVWESEDRHGSLHFPAIDNAIALAADGRYPSLPRLDWDWCGVYPFGTPAYHQPMESTTRECVAEPCNNEGTTEA